MQPEAAEAEERAEHLKERIYVTFTASPWSSRSARTPKARPRAASQGTLFVTVLGTLVAVFTADFVSHLVVHALLPTRLNSGTCSGSASAPSARSFSRWCSSAWPVWTLAQALRASTIALLVTLGLIGFLAVRRVRMSAGKKLLVLIAEVALGVLVVSLELLVH